MTLDRAQNRVGSATASRPTPTGAVVVAVILATSLAAITVARHRFFLTASYDMGYYVNSVWQLAHGSWVNSLSGVHVFADHFSPVMLLLAPVALVDMALGLLVIQAVAVASTVIPAFRLGAHLGGSRLAWICVLWIGLSANVWHTIVYDFRPATLGFVALVWLVSELEVGQRRLVIWALVALAAASREDVAVFAGLAVLIHALLNRRKDLVWPGVASMFVGLWYTLAGQNLFAPFDYFLWYRYADYGDGPLDALLNIGYLVPTVLERVARPEVLVAAAALLVPVLVVPALLGWRRTWPALLIVIANGMSGAPFIPMINYQYYILAVAFVVWGAAHVFADRGLQRFSRPVGYLTVAVFVLAGPILSYASTPVGRSVFDVVAFRGRAAIADELPTPAPSESVSAGVSLVPHLAERTDIYAYPHPMRCGEVLQLYTPETHYPDWVVIRPEERGDLALEEIGYDLFEAGKRVEVWKSSGEHPSVELCPSAEELRLALYERIRASAGG